MNYWENYKKENKKLWHFKPNLKSKDYQYIGRISTNFTDINKLVKNNKKKHMLYVVNEDKKYKNFKLNSRISSFKKWGYKKDQTQFYQYFSDEFPNIFKRFINFSKLDFATGSIIKQYPGNILPWHYDTHVTFKSKIKDLKNKEIIRYMIFLTDWNWGHYFAVGNSVIHQWKKGDVITWKNHMHHCGSNAGMIPKMTMNITGIVNKQSVHLGKKKLFKI
jgi:hypothetical protein